MKTFQLTIAQVDKALFEGKAVSVIVPGVEGEMTILTDHTALISPLRKGVITVKTEEGKEEFFDLESGTVEISQGQVTVLV